MWDKNSMKNQAWSEMTEKLDLYLPSSKRKKTTLSTSKILNYASVLTILLLSFVVYKKNQVIDELEIENNRLLSAEYPQDDFKYERLFHLHDNIFSSSGNDVRSKERSIRKKENLGNGQLSIEQFYDKIRQLATGSTRMNPSILPQSKPSFYPKIAYNELPTLDTEIDKNEGFEKYISKYDDALTEIAQLEPKEDHKDLEVMTYAMSSIDSRSNFSGFGAGLNFRIPIHRKWSLDFGLGYLWARNSDAIQAVRSQEIVVRNTSSNSYTDLRIEYDTKILVNNLHYMVLPLSVNYELTPRLSIGTGIEGRFLINNYFTDRVGAGYNNRFQEYISTNPDKPLQGNYEYDLRKYALGATFNVEYQLTNRVSVFGRYYNGLMNISGDKVYNQDNEIRNNSYKLGIRYSF